MKALVYLTFTKLKNRIKIMFKTPSGIIGLLFIVAIMALLFVTGSPNPSYGRDFRDIREVYAIILALYAFVFIFSAYQGFGNGATMFSMADVNLIFTSSISGKYTLFYGLIQQMGTSLMLAFFLIFQYGWLSNLYGISLGFLAAALLGYAAVAFCAQLTAMVIYMFTSDNETKKNILLGCFIGIVVLFLAGTFFQLFTEGFSLDRVVDGATGTLSSLFPVAGWMRLGLAAIFEGEVWPAVAAFGGVLIYVGVLVVIMFRSNTDYYEDVLKATEVSFSAITARKEGKTVDAVKTNVKVGKTGLGNGRGASAFFRKHMLELRRGSYFILDKNSLIFLVIIYVYSYFIKDAGIMGVFVFATYMQLFTVALGKWVKELRYPYIYMVPESPFKKLLFCLGESLVKALIEALLLFVPLGIIQGFSPVETVMCIVARMSFFLLFTAGNLAVERFFSGLTVKWLALIIYFILMIIIAVPGIAAGVVLGTAAVPFGVFMLNMLTGMTLGNAVIGLVLLAVCQNVLQYAELNDR